MEDSLAAGLRVEPTASDLDHAFAEEANWLL
jgi:hypothetical protein